MVEKVIGLVAKCNYFVQLSDSNYLIRLGGCSAINNMLFVRGDKNEYDNWAQNGCEGWDFQVHTFPNIESNL